MVLVTGALGVLPSKLLELLKEEYKLQQTVKADVEFLSRELESMYASLDKVATVPWDQLDDQVKVWISEVRDASYDMEDLIDSFIIRVGDGHEPADGTRLLKKMGKLFHLSKAKARHDIAGAIDGIKKQLREMSERRDRYKIDDIVARPAATENVDPRLSVLYTEASQLVGIDEPRDELIKMLSIGGKETKIVSVVGLGGLGKTTLVKAVYDKVNLQFDCWAFVPVGQNPEPKKVLRDIINDINVNKSTSFIVDQDKTRSTLLDPMALDERQLINILREYLQGESYSLQVHVTHYWGGLKFVVKTLIDCFPEARLRTSPILKRTSLLAMGSMSELWDEREIQILVLLSFMLQVFLFFGGSIRPRSTNAILRFSLWISYMGADAVAVYVLGLLSRQQVAAPSGGRLSEIHPLSFIWVPFLLIHLGGQDTITAFAMEDNNLWLRHFLNLVVQVALALYVFWKSTVWHNLHLLVTGIFLFVAGMVKYGERTMALMCGTLQSLQNYTADDYMLPPEQTIDSSDDDEYSQVIHTAINSMVCVRDLFGGRTILQMDDNEHRNAFILKSLRISPSDEHKVLEVELRLIYDDLYTKALVLRTRIGIIFRCISLVSVVVALVLFFTISDKQRYSKSDLAITYVLLVGGICLEVCAAFMMVTSAWTWRWLKARNYHRLAGVSWWLLSSRIALPKKRSLWSNSMPTTGNRTIFVGSSRRKEASFVGNSLSFVGTQPTKEH